MRRIIAPAALAALFVMALAPCALAQRSRAPEPPVLADVFAEAGHAAALWLTPTGVKIQPLDASWAPDGPAVATGIRVHALAPAPRGHRGCRDTLNISHAMIARDASTGAWSVFTVQHRRPCRPSASIVLAPDPDVATRWTQHGARFLAEPVEPGAVVHALHRPGDTLSFTTTRDDLVQVGRDGAIRVTDLRARLRGGDDENPMQVTGWGAGSFLVAPPAALGSPRWYEINGGGDVVGEVTLPMANPDVVSGTLCVPTTTDWACVRGGVEDVLFVPRAGDAGMPARVTALVRGTVVPAGGTAVFVVGEDENGARYQLVERHGTRSAVHAVEGMTGVRLVVLPDGRVLLGGATGHGPAARAELRVEPVPALEHHEPGRAPTP